ncbi:hypothetical protein ACLOJK_003955 [Asimina triloba]
MSMVTTIVAAINIIIPISSFSGVIKEENHHESVSEGNLFQQNLPVVSRGQEGCEGTIDHSNGNLTNEPPSSISSRKPKVKKKGSSDASFSKEPDPPELQDAIVGGFCERLEDFCARAETTNDDLDYGDGPSIPLADIKLLVNEIMSARAKKILHLIPVDILVRLLNILDHQIHQGQGLSIEENENSDSDAVSLVTCALESTHASLAIMTQHDMPKQLYKEEIIDRIIDFSRHQIMESMLSCDPSYRALHRPRENDVFDGDEDEDFDADGGSVSKRRRNVRSVKVKKSTGNKCGYHYSLIVCYVVFASYVQHRNFLIDETFQLLWKLPFSKRAVRSYHLPDEEQRQIQMITALLIQLVQCSANLHEVFGPTIDSNAVPEVSVDVNFPVKCHDSATEACCLFWTSVLQRYTSLKSQEVSELKVIVENIVVDLLTALNLPEYPAVALILENAGLKSKDVSTRCMGIDLLGTVAARLKQDAVICSRDKFWIVEEMVGERTDASSNPTDVCCICLDGKGGKSLVCKVATPKNHTTAENTSDVSDEITGLEVVQQVLLNYLQEAGSTDDGHLFARWFYLSLWYKDDPRSQEKFFYYITRLKSKTIVRDFGVVSSSLTRDSAKRISLALGQNNSFARGFDKIVYVLLVSNFSVCFMFCFYKAKLIFDENLFQANLRENSPVLRAKALRAVSVIVEADPEFLCEKHVQCAVEGRFCDSAISVREAALELVGRHIASHPDVGLKYFEKVAERIKDTGVSVRKRAIKIIRDMCISNVNFSEFTNACIEIISRVNDEETSIQVLRMEEHDT